MSGAIVIEAMRQVPVLRWKALRGGCDRDDRRVASSEDVLQSPTSRCWSSSPPRGAGRARRSSRSSSTSSASTRAGSGSSQLDIDGHLGDARALRRPLAADRDALRRRRGRRDDPRRPAATPLRRGGRARARTAERRPRPGTPLLEAREVVLPQAQPGARGRSEPLPDGRSTPLSPSGSRGAASTGLYAHQAETWEAVARGEHVVVTTGTASGKSLAFSLPVLDAIARDPSDAGALPLSDEGARAGPGSLARVPRPARAPARRSTTATRRSSGARTSVARRTRSSRTPTCSTSACSRTTTAGETRCTTCVSSWSTRRTSTAASSARTSRTCFAGCGGSRSPMAPSPVFVLASATIANAGELASRLTGLDVRVVDVDTSPRADREIVLWNPELLDDELGTRASALGGRVPAAGRPRRARPADDLLHEEPQGGGARAPLRERPARRARPPAGSLRTARATRPSSVGRSSGGSSRASCSGSRRRTRSSSGSTSARSTARSPSASPAPSRRSGSSGAAPAGGRRGSPCSSRARTGSTSSS